MAAEETGYRLYHGLADWWPLISPPEEYAEEAAFADQVLRQAARRSARCSNWAAAAGTAPATSRRGSP